MLLSLANELKVLPTDLNRLLIIVVVLSMALTPFLAEAGKRFAESTVEGEEDGEIFRAALLHTLSTPDMLFAVRNPAVTACPHGI